MAYSPITDILIVEDDELSRDLMTRRLNSPTYGLRYAADGQQALDQVNRQKPDLILLDIMLPEIMGLQVLHTLRQQYSMVELPIIMVTAIDEDERIVRALEVGANDYITKPVHFPILLARIQTQLSLKQLSTMNSEFLSTASRDLQKPLDDILLISKLARHQLASSPTIDKASLLDKLNGIVESAQYIQTISNYVLQNQTSGFAQLRLTQTPLQIEGLINSTIEHHLDKAAQKKINLISRHSHDALTVAADKFRLQQTLDYLLAHSIEHCQPQANIYLSSQIKEQQVKVEISDDKSIFNNNDGFILSNEDDEVLDEKSCDDELTELSQLAISKQIIEQHHGRIGAMANDQGGSTYWFSLPSFLLKSID